MSKYTPSVTREFTLEGDTVKVKFARLTRQQFGKLSPFMANLDENGNVPPEQAMKMMDVCAEFLPEIILNFEGLTDANGEPLGKEVVLSEAYFFPLLSEIIGAITEESVVNEKKQSN